MLAPLLALAIFVVAFWFLATERANKVKTVLVAAGLMVKGDPTNSKLYYRLAGSSGTNGPKNMPSGGSLSSDQIAEIEHWIKTAQ